MTDQPVPSGRPALQHRAEDLASTLPPLLVRAERVAATVSQGVHGRRRVGPGDSFWQYRRYQSGDPASAIDWRQSARSDPLFVRETEWAAAQSVWLWRDASPSMAWRSVRALPEKRDRAALLLLALAALLVRGGERVALLGDDQGPGTGRAVLTRLAAALEKGGTAGLPAAQPLPRHAVVALIGDFLAPLDETETTLRRLAASGVRGHLLQVLDPAEESLPFEGRIRFAGLEGEGEVLVRRSEDLRGDYIARLQAHRDGLRELARRTGFTFALHHTDQPPQAALLALHGALSGGPR